MSGSREVKGFKFSVYREGFCLGELDALPVAGQILQFPKNQICIHHMSPGSDRCPPLSILQTISQYSVRCKLESSSEMHQSNLITLHDQCVKELKTAVVLMEDEEIHLVAMESKPKQFPCFWCYSVPVGLYNASLAMLNRRCLAMVFDLDETLIVANTMKSFGDRIKALQSWIAHETDGVRSNEMNAEVKQYMDDQMLLKQYTRNDFVVDGDGNAHKAQWEEVPWVSKNQERLFRPVIRGLRKNIVLTRINPENHDTSVLVRLRPAWEDLRSYLTANGRQRFDVYVCTRAEREYALEMWRLLDPEAHLVGLNQLLDRVICVKSGSQKSLRNVFRDGMCHPKMAMVIDDRSEVWEDKDQPRVLVVPAFTPYCYPQVETAHAVPVLCVARNVACNVRCHFFKEFDENLLQRISEVCYDDEVKNLPSAPDVSNYLIPEVFEIYAKNQEAIDARKYEVPKAIAEQTSCEVKESAIVITDERVEPERMAKTYSMVNQELQNSLSQQTYLEKNIQELKVELGRREHDYTLAMEQIIDLQNQISVIKLENKMLLNAEKRAKGEVDSLLERVHQLQREQAYAKKELKEERDNVRILTLHLEETLNNALRQFSAALDTTLHAVSSPVDEEHPQEPTRRAPKQARNN